MSNRTTIELNHDYWPRDEELLEWAKAMQNYMHSGDRTLLPAGVTFEYMRHHSQPKREQGSWPRGGSTTEELRRAREFCLEAGSPCFGDLGEERVHAMLMEYGARAYSQGYKDALKWIPVEERLPAANERVLIWFRGNTPEGPEFYPMFGEINCGHWRPEGGNGNFDSHVTHWMPAPKAPRSLPIPEAK